MHIAHKLLEEYDFYYHKSEDAKFPKNSAYAFLDSPPIALVMRAIEESLKNPNHNPNSFIDLGDSSFLGSNPATNVCFRFGNTKIACSNCNIPGHSRRYCPV